MTNAYAKCCPNGIRTPDTYYIEDRIATELLMAMNLELICKLLDHAIKAASGE